MKGRASRTLKPKPDGAGSQASLRHRDGLAPTRILRESLHPESRALVKEAQPCILLTAVPLATAGRNRPMVGLRETVLFSCNSSWPKSQTNEGHAARVRDHPDR